MSTSEQARPDDPTRCEGCDGSGVRAPADPGVPFDPPRGYVFIERCDACNKYTNDASAALAVADDVRYWQPPASADQARVIGRILVDLDRPAGICPWCGSDRVSYLEDITCERNVQLYERETRCLVVEGHYTTEGWDEEAKNPRASCRACERQWKVDLAQITFV